MYVYVHVRVLHMCVCMCMHVCVCVCVPLYEQYFLTYDRLYSLSHQKLLTPKAILFVILHNFFTHKTEEFQALMETEIVYSVLFRLLCMGQICYMQKSESCWCHLCETMQTNSGCTSLKAHLRITS